MQARPVETSQLHANPQAADPLVPGTAVTAVGTFAAGQSDQGSIHIVADAETGSFASGLGETVRSVTA